MADQRHDKSLRSAARKRTGHFVSLVFSSRTLIHFASLSCLRRSSFRFGNLNTVFARHKSLAPVDLSRFEYYFLHLCDYLFLWCWWLGVSFSRFLSFFVFLFLYTVQSRFWVGVWKCFSFLGCWL